MLGFLVLFALIACGDRGNGRPPGSAATPTASAEDRSPRPSPSASWHELTSVRGDSRNAIAWAPLSDPDNITVEGSVPSSRAWSTSKVLVIAAYLDTVADGQPDRISPEAREWIRDALAASDNAAAAALKSQIEGSSADAMTRILRSIGDETTRVPDAYEGTMQWSAAEQVRFMAALANGDVGSPETSEFILRNMQPIPEHRWGLGRIGATAFKPGWLRSDTETRQMGIVDGFAVAIITSGEGPVELQSDGDYAHVWQTDRLAHLLKRRLQ